MDENNKNPNEKDPLARTEKKKNKRLYGKFLIFVIFLLIIIESYSYIYIIIIKNLSTKNTKILIPTLIIFIILLLLLISSFITAMNTNPGDIPLYWGFYIGDDDFKRKRYCLICNAFKPERSHHCSVCNKCVLNMDHHCPWVDNCIGFYNRKYFFQLLFYTSIITIYFDLSAAYFVYQIIMDIINKRLKYSKIIDTGIILVTYTFTLVFSFIITMFFKFHIGLIINNSTTIESLDKEHKEENEKFNIGYYENWIQVLGNNKLLWFIPYECEAGRPVGDGLTWKIRNNDIADFNNNNNNSGPKVRNGDQAVELGNIGANNYATSPISPP
jgi:palmitoyltransferase